MPFIIPIVIVAMASICTTMKGPFGVASGLHENKVNNATKANSAPNNGKASEQSASKTIEHPGDQGAGTNDSKSKRKNSGFPGVGSIVGLVILVLLIIIVLIAIIIAVSRRRKDKDRRKRRSPSERSLIRSPSAGVVKEAKESSSESSSKENTKLAKKKGSPEVHSTKSASTKSMKL